MKNRTKVRKITNVVIQVIILILSYGFIYRQVFHKSDLDLIVQDLAGLMSSMRNIMMLVLLMIFMLLNWGIEAWKWQFLVAKLEDIPYLRAVHAVLAGVTISVFTPNRVGEFFGRVFLLRKTKPLQGILVTIVGSVGQLLITILTGSVAVLIFMPLYSPDQEYFSGYLYFCILALIAILDLLLVSLYLNITFISWFRETLVKKWLRRLQPYLQVFSNYHSRELAIVLGLSLLRFIIFSVQYYFLLMLFNVPVPFLPALLIISLIFFMTTAIPTTLITELGVRGSVAIYFFGLYFASTGTMTGGLSASVVAASSLLWLINIAFPAIIGSIFVFRLQFFRKSG